ncbi:MAG: hypothetical protein ACI8QS_000991 [Planctomycetota bacterium]|jgi:hypothetical protein
MAERMDDPWWRAMNAKLQAARRQLRSSPRQPKTVNRPLAASRDREERTPPWPVSHFRRIWTPCEDPENVALDLEAGI